jgi:hypothetical protein
MCVEKGELILTFFYFRHDDDRFIWRIATAIKRFLYIMYHYQKVIYYYERESFSFLLFIIYKMLSVFFFHF